MIKVATRKKPVMITTQIGMSVIWEGPFQSFCPADSWAPSINVYQLRQRYEVCIDLAGVEPASINIHVEPGQLTISGLRAAPQPQATQNQAMRIVTMEIDHGPFCRSLSLPEQVQVVGMTTEYAKGLLWIRLPLHP